MKFRKLEEIITDKYLSMIYPEVQQSYKDITSALESRQIHGITLQGPTGCGKRTLATLIHVANALRLTDFAGSLPEGATVLEHFGLLPSSKLVASSNYIHPCIEDIRDGLRDDVYNELPTLFTDTLTTTKRAVNIGTANIGSIMVLNTKNDYEEYLMIYRRIRSRFLCDDIPGWSPLVIAENWYEPNLRDSVIYNMSLPSRYQDQKHRSRLKSDYDRSFLSLSFNSSTGRVIQNTNPKAP